MRRLVVISYHFPPDGSIGGMRWAGLTKYLTGHGWRSWVITAAAASDGAPGVTVHSCPRRRTLNDHYHDLRARVTSAAQAAEGDGAPAGDPRESWLTRLRLEAAMLLSVPDPGRGWILRAARQARRIISQVQPDVVVSSGPPHSAHLVAWLATRGRSVRWLMDLRDPWGGEPSTGWRSSPYYQSHIARGLTALLESVTVRAASGVLCNTQESVRAMRKRHPGASVRWFPNGVDRELLPALEGDRYPGVGIAHTGTLYGGRDARPLLRGLRLFLDRHPRAAAEGTKLRIAGHISPNLGELLRREVAALGLGERVEELGVLPRAEALRVAVRSRVGVVLAQDQELEVPAKLYELVAMNLPTLVVTNVGSATAAEARRIGAVAVDPTDATGIARFLEDVWLGGAAATPSSQPHSVMLDYRELAAVSDRLLLSDAVAF